MATIAAQMPAGIATWSFPADTETPQGESHLNSFLDATIVMQAGATLVSILHSSFHNPHGRWLAASMGSFTIFHMCHAAAHYTNSHEWYLLVHYMFVMGSMCLANAAPNKSVLSAQLATVLLVLDGAFRFVGGDFWGIISGLSICVWAAMRWHTRELFYVFALGASCVLVSLFVCDVKKQCSHDITEKLAFYASTLCTLALLVTSSTSHDKEDRTKRLE